jgi:hypothetical protein
MSQSIYCDEAGFTGNNLLDDQQPFFSYATVALDADAAKGIVEKAMRDFRLAGSELKAHRLLGSNRGRQALAFVISACAGQVRVAVYHKHYTLASKFFEHIFEPALAEQNSIFYHCGFHKFISNIIYFESLVNTERAVKALEGFQKLMRSRNAVHIDSIFPPSALGADYSAVLRDIETFAICHRAEIAKDVAAFGENNSLYRWMLDVSVGALWNLLQSWGEDYPSLSVYCDASHPLYEQRDYFDIMIGRTDRAYATFEGKQQPLIFNLAESLHFVTSQDHPGIQIADVFATTSNYIFRNRLADGRPMLATALGPAIRIGVFPEEEVVDLRELHGFVNSLVLRELVDRSVKQADLFKGMNGFIRLAHHAHSRFLQTRATPI